MKPNNRCFKLSLPSSNLHTFDQVLNSVRFTCEKHPLYFLDLWEMFYTFVVYVTTLSIAFSLRQKVTAMLLNYVHPLGRPASYLVSRHFRQQFLSYLYQIWHAGLLG